MAAAYNHKVVEKNGEEIGRHLSINVNDGKKPKYYCLDMFPISFNNSNGLSCRALERLCFISDVWSRYKMMHGYYIIHPMGWDAF